MIPVSLIPCPSAYLATRLELNHTSNTAFGGDNYNLEHKSSRLPEGWQKLIKGHACYDPNKVKSSQGFFGLNLFT
jgi:hypothetical protein